MKSPSYRQNQKHPNLSPKNGNRVDMQWHGEEHREVKVGQIQNEEEWENCSSGKVNKNNKVEIQGNLKN